MIGHLESLPKPNMFYIHAFPSSHMYPEQVMGVVPNLSAGMLGQQTYTLVITNYRLIFARLTNQMVNQEIERAKSEARQSGEGFLGTWAASTHAGFSYHNRYHKMPPQAILQENPSNYEIRPEQVKSVKITSGYHDPQYSQDNPGKMVIKWTGGKVKFTLDRMEPQQIRSMLFPLLGARVK